MNIVILAICLFLVFIFSLGFTGLVRNYSIKHAVIDEPNERSLHTTPTPRGGGIVISLSVLTGIFILYILKFIPAAYVIALGGGGLMVSLVGWIDDHKNIKIIWRALVYILASAWAVFWVGDLNTLSLGNYFVKLPYIGNVFAILGIAWLTNLYNFMDGTDALAGLQTLCTAIFSGLLFWISSIHGLAIVCFILALSSAGFLAWNWPPARIFMGDVGSCLIGFVFGVMALIGELTNSVPLLIWIILLGLFICDATLTLIKRILSRERWYSAHRSHAYQRYVQMGASHQLLAIVSLFINILFLWSAAFLSFKYNNLSAFIALFVVILLSMLWSLIQWRFRNVVIAKE